MFIFINSKTPLGAACVVSWLVRPSSKEAASLLSCCLTSIWALEWMSNGFCWDGEMGWLLSCREFWQVVSGDPDQACMRQTCKNRRRQRSVMKQGVCVCLFLSTWLVEHLHKGCSSPFPISASCSFSCGLYLGHHTIPSKVTGDVWGLGFSMLVLLLSFFTCGCPALWGWAATPPVLTVTAFPCGWGRCPVLPALRI